MKTNITRHWFSLSRTVYNISPLRRLTAELLLTIETIFLRLNAIVVNKLLRG
jgi:hypothetical protein